MDPVTRASWKTLPAPHKRERLVVQEVFSDSMGDRMRNGHVPIDMDDKWFIHFEDDWLHFHRSWTGAHIFALRLDAGPAGTYVAEGWASRDPEQYRSLGADQDQRTVVELIRRYFGQ